MLVEKLLSPAFDDILDVDYTRELEEELDKIEDGKNDYETALSSFYKKFEKDLKRAAKEMINLKEGVEPDPKVACDKCGSPMVIKAGKFGLFLACSALSRVREHARARNAGGRMPRAARSKRTARTAASRWRSSAAASVSSSPAPATRSARRRARSSRPSRGWRPPSPIRSSTRSARSATRTWSSSRAGSASSRRAAATRRASTSSRSRPVSSARRTAATSSSGSRGAGGVLRLRELSGLRLHAVEPADAGKVPRLRRAVPGREDHQAPRPSAVCNNEECSYVRSEELAPA